MLMHMVLVSVLLAHAVDLVVEFVGQPLCLLQVKLQVIQFIFEFLFASRQRVVAILFLVKLKIIIIIHTRKMNHGN